MESLPSTVGYSEPAINFICTWDGFVKVIDMVDEGGPLFLEGDFAVGANQDGDSSGPTGAAGGPVLVDGEVCRNNDPIAAVPVGGGDPVQGVDEGVGGPVAGVDAGGA